MEGWVAQHSSLSPVPLCQMYFFVGWIQPMGCWLLAYDTLNSGKAVQSRLAFSFCCNYLKLTLEFFKNCITETRDWLGYSSGFYPLTSIPSPHGLWIVFSDACYCSQQTLEYIVYSGCSSMLATKRPIFKRADCFLQGFRSLQHYPYVLTGSECYVC